MTSPYREHREAMAVASCSHCGAAIGEPCRTTGRRRPTDSTGETTPHAHIPRVEAAARRGTPVTVSRQLPVPDDSAAAVVDTAALDVDSLDEDLIGACARAIAAPMLASELRRMAVDVFGGAAGAHVRAVLRVRADELEFRVSMR